MTAAEVFEYARWGENGVNAECPRCYSKDVHQMVDSKTGGREKHYRWRCHACKKQFTVRVGTIMHNSKISLDHWLMAMQAMNMIDVDTTPVWGEASYLWRELGGEVTFKSVYYMLEKIKNDWIECDVKRDIAIVLSNMSSKGEIKRRKKDGFYGEWTYQKVATGCP